MNGEPTDLCDCCRDDTGRHLFNSWKESGGGAVFACEPCAEWLRVSLEASATGHCFVCSDPTDDGYQIAEAGKAPDDGALSRICSACRKQLVFNHGRPVFVSRDGGDR